MSTTLALAGALVAGVAAGALGRGWAGRVRAHRALRNDNARLRSAESAALEANRLLRAAEQIAQVGHWRLDLRTSELVCSEQVYRISGGAPTGAAIPLAAALAAYHPDDQSLIGELMQAAIVSGADFQRGLRLVREGTGEVRHVVARGICERTLSGELCGLFGVITDVTENVRAETAMAETNRLLRLSGQVAQLGYWRADMLSGQVTWSDDMYAIYDMMPGEPVTLELIFGSNEAAGWPGCGGYDPALTEAGDTFERQRRIVRRDGETRHLLVRGVCEARAGERCAVMVGVAMDITALKRAEEAAKETEARYRLIAENATDIFCRFDPDSTIRWVSPAVRTVLGHDAETLLGRRVIDVMHPDDVPQIKAAFRALVAAGADGRPTTWRYRTRHRDGRWIWLEGRPRASFDATTGRVTELQDVIRDITVRKQTEERLEAAQAAAEAAAAAKSEFLATMSHELRTPLTSIIGFAGLLQAKGSLGETEARFVRRINDASRMLLNVVNDVLEFSKLEAGRTDLEARRFALGELVEDTVALVAANAAEKGLALTLDVAAPETALIGDAGRLRQVLLNLLSNAVKFTATGSVSLKVEQAPFGAVGRRVTFSVTDTGPGVPTDRVERLFQRFSQADGSTSRRYGGSGLGLAICRGLIELMAGQIGVDTTEGQGSRFWFAIDLPLAEPVALPAPIATAIDLELRPGRVLAADDAEANRELIRLLVGALGHDIEVVENGQAAVEAVEAGGDYDLILMDVHMPVLDGVGATRRIRALGPERGAVPIVALTADVLPEQIEAFRAAGLDDHLAKPISPAALAVVLDRWFGRRSEVLRYSAAAEVAAARSVSAA